MIWKISLYTHSPKQKMRMTRLLVWLLLPAVTWADLKTGFEEASAGEIRKIKTTAGIWAAPAGHAEVTAKYHFTGKQCLHIFGGKERRIEFSPAKAI